MVNQMRHTSELWTCRVTRPDTGEKFYARCRISAGEYVVYAYRHEFPVSMQNARNEEYTIFGVSKDDIELIERVNQW